jgi:hypothetical protein
MVECWVGKTLESPSKVVVVKQRCHAPGEGFKE